MTTTIRINKEAQSKLKNYCNSNNISMLNAVDQIVTFIIANGYTVEDLKQINSESSFDRIYKRIDDVISIFRASERDNIKPLIKQVRYIDENVDTILSNMQIVQNYELETPQIDEKQKSDDPYSFENFSKDRDGKWFMERAQKGSKICDKFEELFKKMDSRVEIVNNEKRYILNDEIIKDIEYLKDLVKNF